MSKTKQDVLNYLFRKLDTIKIELHNARMFGGANLYIQEFETDGPYVGYEQVMSISKRPSYKTDFVKDTRNYLEEIRAAPVHKILKSTRKIVTYKDSVYKLQEKMLNECNLVRKLKQEAIVVKKEEKEFVSTEDDTKRIKLHYDKSLARQDLFMELEYKRTHSQDSAFILDCYIYKYKYWDKLVEKEYLPHYERNKLVGMEYYRHMNLRNIVRVSDEFLLTLHYYKRYLPDMMILPPKNTPLNVFPYKKQDRLYADVMKQVEQPRHEDYKTHLVLFKDCKMRISRMCKLSKGLHHFGQDAVNKKQHPNNQMKDIGQLVDKAIEEWEDESRIVKNEFDRVVHTRPDVPAIAAFLEYRKMIAVRAPVITGLVPDTEFKYDIRRFNEGDDSDVQVDSRNAKEEGV